MQRFRQSLTEASERQLAIARLRALVLSDSNDALALSAE
jgi:hypothetical protein